MSLDVSTRVDRQGAKTVYVKGRLDTHTYRSLDEHLAREVGPADNTLVLDLAGLDYISSAGIRSVFALRKQLAARGGRVLVVNVQPQVRKDFPDAIYWLSDLVTDAAGRANVSLKYPDALTTWRLTARAITRDTKAGVAIARTTTTKDLIVRIIREVVEQARRAENPGPLNVDRGVSSECGAGAFQPRRRGPA